MAEDVYLEDDVYYEHPLRHFFWDTEDLDYWYRNKYFSLPHWYLVKHTPSKEEQNPLRYFYDLEEELWRGEGSHGFPDFQDLKDCVPKVINFNKDFPVFDVHDDYGNIHIKFKPKSYLRDEYVAGEEKFWALCEVIWNLRLFNFQSHQ